MPRDRVPSDPDGIVQVAIKDLRDAYGDRIVVMADLCLDEYTDHGHCGLLTPAGTVDNDATLERYAEVALAQADAGVDICAPSGMMDGQVLAIRDALDEEGCTDVAILAYAAKYASALYGPFREAVDVEIADGGDRRAYQQDWHNVRESLEEIRADIAEGADMVMVKPALTYLDVLTPCTGRGRRAARGVPRVRRVRDGARRGRTWLDRRRRGGAGADQRDQACRSRHGADLLRPPTRRRAAVTDPHTPTTCR